MTTPFRLSERNFRFYEPCIKAIVDNYTNDVTFDPALSKRSPATFAARLRDAMLALVQHPDWNRPLSVSLNKIRPHISVVQLSDGRVTAGPMARQQTAVVNTQAPPAVPITQEPIECYAIPIRDLCWLAHHHALAIPLRVQVTDDYVARLEAEYDVAFEHYSDDRDGTYILT